MPSALLYDRLQFAFTSTFHYLFPQLTMGLALLLLYLRSRALISGDEHYHQVARFWTKVFAFGVVTGIPLEFQFGTNWAKFSNFAGGVIGQMLSMEGMFAFFLESSFLGILLFGEKRLSQRVQWFAALMLFLGSWLSGYFIVALWTNFMTGPDPGILDWFTILMGVTSASILAFHGANYLAMKTDGQLRGQARRAAGMTGSAVAVLIGLAIIAVSFVQPFFRLNYAAHPIGYLFPLVSLATLIAALGLRRRNRDVGAFYASSLMILAMLAGMAWRSYPNILIAMNDPANSVTVTNATAGAYGMQVGLWWFFIGFGLIVTYQDCAHRAFWGKVQL